jgi:hypothetical protein
MKKLIAFIVFLSMSSVNVYSQSVLQKVSVGAGLGVQLPVGDYKITEGRKLLGDFTLQYKISKYFSAAFNISFENSNSITVSYLNFSTRYNYLNYKNTLLPYFDLGIGAYYGNELLVKDDVWMYYSDRKSYFGGSLGTGLDLKLSPYTTLDLNIKYHTFTFSEPRHFFTVSTDLKFNL